MQKQARTQRIPTVLLLMCILTWATTSDADQYDLYAAMGNESFVLVDIQIPALELIGDIGGFAPRSMTYDFANDIIYAIDIGDSTQLAVIDPCTGVGSYLGALTLPEPDFVGRAEALAYNSVDGLLYCSVSVSDYNAASEALCTVDPVTQEVTILGEFDGTYANDGDAMVFIDGVLYLVDDPHQGPSYFYQVDYQANPGQATLIGILSNPRFNNVNDMTFDPETRTLYGFDPHSRLLITIDWLTGSGTLLGSSHGSSDFEGSVMSSITVGLPCGPNAVPDDAPDIDMGYLQVVPNPFNPSTTFEFQVPGNAGETVPIDVSVFDLAGRKVRELHVGPISPGLQSLQWNGRDARGAAVASGVYIACVRGDKFAVSQTMTLLK